MEKLTLSQMNSKNFSKAVNEIYLLTDYNHDQYPDYMKWFYTKSVPRVLEGTGEMIVYLDALSVAGLTILKKTEEEKKLCTVLINPDYRKRGYSKQILEDSFDYFGTDKPLITIPEFRIDEFSKIINAYGWEQTSQSNNYSSNEIVFNESKVFGKKLHNV